LPWIHLAIRTAVPSHSTPGSSRSHYKVGALHGISDGVLTLNCDPFQSHYRQHNHRSTNRLVHSPQHLLKSRIADQITLLRANNGEGFRDSPSGRDRMLLVHSPLLQQSLLLASPPLNDMLKLSGLLTVRPVTKNVPQTHRVKHLTAADPVRMKHPVCLAQGF